MYFMEKLLDEFSEERRLKISTIKGYESALGNYEKFNKMTMSAMIDEAIYEESHVEVRNRKIKKRLINFRKHCLDEKNLAPSTVKGYMNCIRTFYRHYECHVPYIPPLNVDEYETNYYDLPNKEHLSKALNYASLDMRAVILFMSSSGSAMAETIDLTVNDFINATSEYHSDGDLKDIIQELYEYDGDIIPTWYIHRVKTNKYYYTFCTNECTDAIIQMLRVRNSLDWNESLFGFSRRELLTEFQKINDYFEWGKVKNYRFFHSHALRKFFSSNIGLGSDYVDMMQGRGRKRLHETYIKSNPKVLKKVYMGNMKNVMVKDIIERPIIHEDITVNINLNFYGSEYSVSI